MRWFRKTQGRRRCAARQGAPCAGSTGKSVKLGAAHEGAGEKAAAKFHVRFAPKATENLHINDQSGNTAKPEPIRFKR